MTHPGHEIAKYALEKRYTVRLDLEIENGKKKSFFLKKYRSLLLFNKLKIYFRLNRLASDARPEWNAMWTFLEIGLPGPVPVALGHNKQSSLVLSEGVNYVMRLSDWAERNFGEGSQKNIQSISAKHRIIEAVANIIAKMHSAGLVHQDLYLCHFLCGSEDGLPLTLIDLQRVKKFRKLPVRWQVKDLAQLHFSSARYLTKQDIQRFWKVYDSVYHNAKKNPSWRSILRKSNRIRRHTLKHKL
jgi:heptose I phosphotransferase